MTRAMKKAAFFLVSCVWVVFLVMLYAALHVAFAAADVRSFSQGEANDGTSNQHVLTLPPVVSAGDTILCYHVMDDGTSPDDPQWPGPEWNVIEHLQSQGQFHVSYAWKKAIGNEAGTTITVTTISSAEVGGFICQSFMDAADPEVTPPIISVRNEGNTEFPSSNGLTGLPPADYLCLAKESNDNGNDQVATWPPTHPDNRVMQATGTAQGVHQAVASVSPGPGTTACGPSSWTLTASDQWIAHDIAISPAVAGFSAVLRRRRQ